MAKKVIQRNLPLTVKYSLVKVTYLSIEDGGGCGCDNCGKIITNIAHIKSTDGKNYNIGLDCLDTLLENNNLLEHESHVKYLHSDKPAILKAKSLRAKLLKKAKDEPTFTATFHKFDNGFGFSFEVDKIKKWRMSDDKTELVECEPYIVKDPQGFDYRFDLAYLELTLNYLKGLKNVIIS